MAAELWRELGESMRRHRLGSGRSLRDVEVASKWGRGTLSQVENGKARPSQSLVSWYDNGFVADGLLLSMYAEARAAHPAVGPIDTPDEREFLIPGDSCRLLDAAPPTGQQVMPGEDVYVRWVISNAGNVAWHGRRFRRVGAHAGVRILGGPRLFDVPAVEPGDLAELELVVRAPDSAGSVVAHWRMVDQHERYCHVASELLSVLLVVHR